MTDKFEWIVVIAQNGTGKRNTLTIWAPDENDAIRQAIKLTPDLTWAPTHAVRMTAEDEEQIADMEWWKMPDDEEEEELDRERERFDTFRIG